MVYMQDYKIHLLDGTVIEATEEYDERIDQETLPEKYEKSDPDHVFCVGDPYCYRSFIPKRSILYIEEGSVRKACFYEKRGKHEQN